MDSSPTNTEASTSTTATTTTSEDLVEVLRDDGFSVADGWFGYSTMEGCCDPGAQCWGNNPATPYGMIALPPGPGQTALDDDVFRSFGPVPAGLSRNFRLRADEAVVVYGNTPPASKYFGIRSSLGTRLAGPDGWRKPILGSLGASLNNQVIAAQWGTDDIYERPFAVITSADLGVETRVATALVAAGFQPDQIFHDRIDLDHVLLGLGDNKDGLYSVTRVAIYDDPERGEAYLLDPGLTVLRVSSLAPILPERHAQALLPARGTGTDESAYADALVQLEQAIRDAHPLDIAVLSPAEPYWADTLNCIDSWACAGDIRDRYTALSPEFKLNANDESVVVFGVNHERTGKASYSSASLQTVEGQRGILSFNSDQMVASARAFLPDHPQADDLYAVTISFDCAGQTGTCITVPTACPGPGFDTHLKVTIRAYLEPATGAAPAAEELLPDQMFKFWPVP